MKFYLVDYENVHESGLVGLNKLDKNAEVHIFYSKNANKLNFDLLNKILKTSATIVTTKIEATTKNALDFILTFCAAELSLKHPDSEIYIVSKDQGYDCLSQFTEIHRKIVLNRILNLNGDNSVGQKNDLQKQVADALKNIKLDNVNKGDLINVIVDLILNYKTKSAINNNVNKYLKDGASTKIVCKAIKPLLKDKT